ncbi:general substrate transporter [Umbelopsis sp. PMI_123]|nr:general substrate transporter [Umbelopsis sp. PMI_123]
MSDQSDVTKADVKVPEHEFDFDMLLKDATPKLEKSWWHYPHLRKLNFFLLSGILVQATNGYDGSLLNGLQSLPQWDGYFNNPSGATLGTLSSGTTFGLVAFLPMSNWMCDKYGRRWPIIVGSLLTVVGAVIQAAAVQYWMFWIGRFILGTGLAALQVAGPMLLAETAYPAQRAQVTSLYEVSFPLGALVGAWVTYGSYFISSTWAWRLPSLLQCFPAVIQIILAYYCPESPRWLVAKGRIEEARAVLGEYHGAGDADCLLVRYELAEIQEALKADYLKKTTKWSEWFRTKGNRKRLAIIMFIPVMTQLSGNAVVSYYLHLILNSINITSSKDQLVINATLLVLELVSAVVVAAFCDMAGRRRVFMTGIIGMLVCFIPWTILSAQAQQGNFSNPALSRGVLAMIYLFEIPYHIVSPISPLFVMEVSPYELRSKASTIFQLMGQVAAVFNNYVNPIALTAIGWKYYIVFCCIITLQFVVVYFFFPETRGLSLEEISVLFEGQDAAVGNANFRRRDAEDPAVVEGKEADDTLEVHQGAKSS